MSNIEAWMWTIGIFVFLAGGFWLTMKVIAAQESTDEDR